MHPRSIACLSAHSLCVENTRVSLLWSASTLIVLTIIFARTVAAQELGMDPGMLLDSAVQTRRGTHFFLDQPDSQAAIERNYQLIAVAEQGTLQDSRPFEIIDSTATGKLDYQAASNNNVSPFFFQWNRLLGRLSASLEVDTASETYYYRNRAGLDTTPASPLLRDQARTIYRAIPADIGTPGLPQLKNSLDDFVHMAFFEHDGVTAAEFLSELDTLSYSITLQAGATELEHPFNYEPADSGARQLKPRTGSRIVASIHWSEDRDSNGVDEVYLVEINLGGSSSNPAWQTGQRCAQDLQTHTNVITGQYLVLGGEYWLGSQDLPLSANRAQSLTIDWGLILRQLTRMADGADCKLKATLQPRVNTLGLGVAIEARGAVLQSLDIAGATAHRQDSRPAMASEVPADVDSTESDAAVQVQFSTVPIPASSGHETSADRLQPYISGAEIRLPLVTETRSGGAQQPWWQILSAVDWSPRCSQINNTGADSATHEELSCQVLPGLYSVIEHSSGARWDNLRVLLPADNVIATDAITSEADGLVFDDTNGTLSWTQPGWYQVLREPDYLSVCESSGYCELAAGVYQVVNHHTGRKWRNFVVPLSP